MKFKHFGTDGIRGIVGEGITPDFIVRTAKAIAVYLKGKRASVIIGYDTRGSCSYISNILSGVLSGYGINVTIVGIVPSAALSFLTVKLKGSLGIMVSASHNDFRYNGLKFFAPTGEKLGDKATAELDNLITQNRYNLGCADSERVGRIKHNLKAAHMWERYLITYFKPFFLDSRTQKHSLAVHIDCAFGSGGIVARKVLETLGFEVHLHNEKYDGFNINRNSGAIFPLYTCRVLRNLKNNRNLAPMDWVKGHNNEEKKLVGFSFDGDADRCVMVDSNGEIVHGDALLFELAKFLKSEGKLAQNTLVATVMFNLGAEKSLGREGIMLLRTPVGDSHVYKAVNEKGLTLGGETSGHIIFPEIWCCGDGLVTALVALLALQNTESHKVHELFECGIFPQITKNVPVTAEQKAKFEKNKSLNNYIKQIQQKNQDYRIIVRPSGTEMLIRVTVEGKEHVNCERLTEDIVNKIQKS